jgi:transcriptional regulator with XRE-family HTH domain
MTKVTNIRDAISEQIARVREALKDRVHSKVAEATGLHVNTVRNIAKNSNQKFSLATIEKLENYLFGEKV